MAALGGVLSALLLLALAALTVLVYKLYGHRLVCGFGRALVRLGVGAGAARWGAPRGVAGSESSRRRGAVEREQDGGPGSVRQRAAWETEGGWWSAWEMGRRGEESGVGMPQRLGSSAEGQSARPPSVGGAGWPSPAGRWLTAGSCPPPEVPASRV